MASKASARSTPLVRGESLQARIDALAPWFHNMELGGCWTAPRHPLGNYPASHWRYFQHAIPEDLSGKSVLDIGCNGGFYSIEMKRRGARRVVAADFDERYLAQAKLAAQAIGVELEFRKLSVYDVASLGERFDIVLFMGVLYHLRHPLLALDLIHEHVAGDLLIFHSLLRGGAQTIHVEDDYPFSESDVFGREGFPVMHFIEKSYAGDPTNWWIPNRACVEAMLRSAGFDILAHPDSVVYVCRRSERAQNPETGPAAHI
ncbi:MAG: TIGR04290 family methyltransferase [Beijerinckiaceae bacterium]|nr:TIGR04290 family methyltransferase [Beijerinckiaceae bacterium]